MTGKRKDITGKKFGKLTAVKLLKGKRKRQRCPTWLFLCDCGKYISYPYDNVVYSVHKGRQSCGCLRNKYYANKKKFIGATNIKGTCVERIKSKKPNKNNKSGVKGVFWDKARKQWCAKITFMKKAYNLGRFSDKKKAVEARKQAEKKLYRPFLKWYDEYNKKLKKTDRRKRHKRGIKYLIPVLIFLFYTG